MYICFPKHEIVFTSVPFYNFFVNLTLFVGGYMTIKVMVAERDGEKQRTPWPRWKVAQFDCASLSWLLVLVKT